jgi:hypothetical protein
LHTKAEEAAPIDEDATDDHLGYDGPYPVFNMSLNLVKGQEQTVPVQVNVTLPTTPEPSPAVTPSPVPTTPGPGSIPVDPIGWSKAAENAATQPLYQRVQAALEKFGFDVSSLTAPDADADKPKAKDGA